MNTEQLYNQLKAGQINKSQLTLNELDGVYKYMIDTKKVSTKEFKPSVVERLNIPSVKPVETPKIEQPENQSLFGKIGNLFKPQSQPQSQLRNTTVNPRIDINTTPNNYAPKQSTNPENELVDLLSSLSMPKTEPTLDRGRTTKHERQQGSAYVPGNIVQPTPTDLTLADRVEQGIKGIGYNWAGGNLSTVGTIAELGQQGLKGRLERDVTQPQSFYAEDLKDKSQIQQQYSDTEKAYISDALNASKTSQADELLAKGQQHTAKGREGLGTAGGVAYDILTGAGQMAADIGTAYATGVGMLPVLGTRVFGQSASEARQSGATPEQQIAYGAISAGIEIATEKLVGGLPMAEKLGMGGVADNTIKKLASGIASSPRLSKALTYIANMAGEGAEEMIAEILSPVAQRITYDPNADWATMEEVLYSGLIGAGVSGVMGGGVLFQGNEQTPTQTQTQSVSVAENIEPDIQGFQNTIDTGLNQLYTVLDTQPNEQAIDKMITNLEQVKQLMPVLSEYVDGHIAKLNSYKTEPSIKSTANENTEVEQIVNEDINIAQNEDKGVTEDIKNIDAQIDDSVIDTQTPTIEQEEIEQPIEEKIEEIEMPTAEDYQADIEEQEELPLQEEYPIGTKIEARNGYVFEVISKEGNLIRIKNTETNQEQNYTLGGLKRLGTVLQGSNESVTENKQVEPIENIEQLEETEQINTKTDVAENETTETVKTENITETKQTATGNKGTAKDNEGNAIGFVYEVVNANDLITSHDVNLNVNEKYPNELQPRERTRAASQMQVNDIVNNLQPEFLGENPKISDGSPIVGNDNIVESGNGRTIALTKMYQSKHKNAQKYTDWLISNAETFGIDTNNLPNNPVLVRRRITEVDRADFVKKANESSIATMSATETARSDADKLTNKVLSLFVANENGIINTTDNKGFIGKFISEVVPKNEQNKYITDKGELSQEGLARVRNAIFYKAYGDINLMNKLAESLDNNAKNIINTMLAIAPKIVDIKTNIAKGNLYNIDYSSDIAQAANEFMALKETGKDVELYLQQESLFDNEDTALIKDIIAIFNTNNRSVKKMTTILNKLFDSIENLGNPNQINMFGEMETPDKVHVLEATLRRLESEDNAQVTLFQSERKESTGDTQSNKGQTRAYKGGESYTRVNNSDLIDMSRPLKKPTEIRKDITKMFSIPNTTKKFNRSKKYLGYYKVMPEVIRLRYDNDIGTVMHELGHHFDKKYGFNSLNKQLIADMINKMNPAFKKNYQKSELPGEAIAEFLRYYTTDPNTASEFAGDFYELFEKTLSKDDLKNIQEVRSDTLRWVNAERAEKRQSTIVPLSQKKKVSERISETIKFEKNNALLFDRYARIQEFTKTVEKLTGKKLPPSLNPHLLVERTYKNNSTIEGLIKGQLRDTEFKPLDTDDSLQKIVDDVKRDVTQFEDYLKLKHAITLAEKEHMIYNTDIYNDIKDMQQDLKFIEQQYPQFIELSERLYDWYDKFFKAWVVDTNMLGEDSKKIYAKMRQEYPYYVPMFRVREDGSGKQASSSLTDQKAPVDRLSEKGSDRDTISPIDNIVTQVSRMVNAYSKNNVMRAIVENYNTVDGLGGFIDRVPPDMEKQILSTQKIKDSIETDFEGVDGIDLIIDSIPDLIENYKPLTKSKDREIVGVITKSGKRQFYQVFDKAFLNSLTNMNPTQLDASVRIIASIRRTTTGLTTGLNPIFGIVSNAPRDFTQAYVFGSYKNPAEYVYEYAKALTGVIKGNDNYKLFKDIGGVYGSSMTSELRNKDDFIRRLTKYRKGQKVRARNALSYIGEMILDFNDAIETAPRLAEFNKAYKIAKKRGDSDYDATLYALSRADDVTLNFSRRGEIMNTAVGQSIPYLNAGLQGMDKLRRGLFTGEERTQTLIKSITMLTIPTILLWLAHRDDEDYEKLTKGIKDNYWILWKNDDGSFARIPKPKDLSTIFSADFERALNAYFKEQGAGAFEGFYSTIADSLLPPVDTIFRPLIDVVGNEKWSGGKIVPMSMEYLPKTEQYDETTSRIAVELAQLIGKVASDSNFASPKNVDYVLDQYYGGLADILLPMTTPTTYVDADTLKDKYKYLARPVAAIMKTGETINRKFKADPSYSNDVVNDFYELRDKTAKANNAYKNRRVMSDDVDLISENQFKAYYKSISSMWKTIDYIDGLANKTLPDEHNGGFKKLINQSRFADSEKQKIINDLKDNKLNRESIVMLQKTIRDEIVKLADKAVKNYKENHKSNNEQLKNFIISQGQ